MELPANFPAELLELTHRERDVLLLMAEDLSGPEIAQRLTIELGSVDNYKNRLAHKLNQHGPRLLYRYARNSKPFLDWLNSSD